MVKAKNVDEYIAHAPKEVQGRLTELRKIILSIMPKETEEKISYSMPFYDYKGRLVYFGIQKGYIGLYIPPPIIADYEKELKNYVTTKSAIHFPNSENLPVSLIRKLVNARIKWNEKSGK